MHNLRRSLSYSIFSVAALLLCGRAFAQDTRQVDQPKTPQNCAVLTAQLTPHHGMLTAAEESGHRDNARIEKALAACPAGQAVVLRASSGGANVFLIGPMKLQGSLLIEPGVAVWGSRNPRDYDISAKFCGSTEAAGCKPLILAENAAHSSIVGDGVIDGRGGAPLLGQTKSWWDAAFHAMATNAKVSVPQLIAVRGSDDFMIAGVTLRNAPGAHVAASQVNGFTAWGTKIDAPKWAIGTDGIDLTAATNITIADVSITTGGDNVQMLSVTAGAVTHATLSNNHYWYGHGLGIGGDAGDVSAIRVKDLNIDDTDDGLRIRSIGSTATVSDVEVDGACMHGALNPVMITPLTATVAGTQAAHYSGITLKDFHILTQGQFIVRGPDADHAVEVKLNNVVMDGAKPDTVPAKFANITIAGNGRGGVVPGGEGVTIGQSNDKSGTLYDCTDKFTEFPVDTKAPASVAAIPPASKTIYIAADGSAQYYSLEAAIHRVPPTGASIQIAPGVYRERTYITQNHVALRSLDTDPTKTILVYDTGAGNGRTEHSPLPSGATLGVVGDDFLAENLTIQNDYKRTHHQPEPTSAAEAVYTESDRSVFRNVRILGVQDTLFIASKSGDRWCKECKVARMYFPHSYVAGGVDFIYGDAKAVFEDCEIHSVGKGYLTAQSRHFPAQDSGFVFNHCKLTADPGVLGPGGGSTGQMQGVYLGRPWQTHATVVYLNTEMGPQILPVGWSEWHDLHRLDTAFFAEYNSTGPGADAKDRNPKSHQLTAAEAAKFETKRYLAGSDNWDPTKVQ